MIKAEGHDDPWLSRTLARLYEPLLDRALARPAFVLILAGALLVLTVVLFPLVGKTFMPTMDEGDLIISEIPCPWPAISTEWHDAAGWQATAC